MRQPDAVVAEVGEGDDGALAHAEHVTEHLQGMARLLQGLAEDDVIEGLVRVVVEAGFDVALIDGSPAGDRGLDEVRQQFYATGVDIFVLHQPGDQFAIAAAEVEDARAGRDDGRDDLIVEPAQDILHEGAFHAAATRAKVLARKPRTRSDCASTSSRNAS